MAIEKPISDLLLAIDKGEYMMPEFQRGYVWNSNQVKGFMRSLYLGYPSGSFLIWKTENPSEIRGEDGESNSIYKKIILDGQQRLTTIYTILRGKTPVWYEGASLRSDLYFNLETDEFQYYKSREMDGKPEWMHLSNYLVNGGLTGFMSRIGDLNDEDRAFYMSGEILGKLTLLDKIKDYGYYIKEIAITEVDKVVEIFNLVNKSGTTLSESDLALAIITSSWDGVKNRFREKIEEYKKYNYYLDFNFFTRLLNMLTTDKALYTNELSLVTNKQFDEAWDKINRSLSYLINILREDAYIDSNTNLSTNYVLYTLVYYLTKNDNKFPSEEIKRKAIFWMFTAQLWGWYSGSSESYLTKDVNVIKDANDINKLIDNLSQFRGKHLYLDADDLAYQGSRSKIYNLFYCVIRSQDARDWTDVNVPLYSRNIGFNNVLQVHHIYPKSKLYQNGYNSSNNIERSMVNEIANRVFITQKSNMKIFTDDPAEYLPQIDQEQLRKQFVPLDTSLYTYENYERFLEERRKLLAQGINKFLASYFDYQSDAKMASDLQHYNEDIEKIEFALRDKISDKLEAVAEDNAYKELVPSHIQVKVDDKIAKHLGKNPGISKEEIADLRSKLNFFDVNEYKLVITSKSNWGLFNDIFGEKSGILQNKFHQLGELRNCIRHSRDVNEVVLKEGEAAIAWFNMALRNSENTVDA